MRLSLTRKFTFLLVLIAGGILIFITWADRRMQEMTGVYQQIGAEWIEIRQLLGLQREINRIYQAIAGDELSSETMHPVADALRAFRVELDEMQAFQGEQLNVVQSAQLHESSQLAELEALWIQVERTWVEYQQAAAADRARAKGALLGHLNQGNLLLNAFAATANEEVQEEVEIVNASQRMIDRALIVLAVTMFALFGLMAAGFFFGIILPVRRLRHTVLRIRREHDYDNLPQAATRDEIGDLIDTFSSMAREINTFTKDLERQIESRTRELLVSEKLAAVGRLAAGLAHEINNPLASIGACAEGLQQRAADLNQPLDVTLTREYMGLINDEVRRCKTIIEKLLDFARVKPACRVQADLTQICHETLRLGEEIARQKHCAIHARIATEPIAVLCDPDQIKQIVLNLLINAIDACEGEGEITIVCWQQGQSALLEVRDTGCGIEAADFAQLFEPFFSRKRTGTGNGLGLPISQRLAEAHQGRIRVQSDGPRTGACFTLELPIQSGPVPPGPSLEDASA